MKNSSVSIEEITSLEFAEVQKPSNRQKKKKIIDETLCKRSDRISMITKGFKGKADVESSNLHDDRANIHSMQQSSKKQKKNVSVNLGP